MPTHSAYGDGSEIPEDVIQHIRDVSWQCAVGFQMERGADKKENECSEREFFNLVKKRIRTWSTGNSTSRTIL